LKILQINSVCGIGSTGRIATDLHSILSIRGHQSTIAFGRDVANSCENVIRIGSRYDNYLHAARTRIFDGHGFGSAAATKRLINQIEDLDPDLIHLHNLHGYYLNIDLLFKFLKRVNKPVVWTLHDCWAFTGHCAHFDFEGCDRWKNECHGCPLKNEYPKSLLFDNSRNNFNRKKVLFSGIKNLTIVTPSKWLAGLVEQSYLNGYQTIVINTGIDLNLFKPASGEFRTSYHLENEFIILGVASVFSERKGLDYFIGLANKLKIDEKIVLVGVTEKQKSNLPHGIIGITKINSAMELAEIYSAADVFLNPTLEDNFPTTNLEALACGVPVITFNSGGSPECLDASCGFIVERGNLSGILSAIEVVRANGKRHYTTQCQKRAYYLYNKNLRFGEYLKLYESLIHKELD
jgi:glycosyltransferase involved in cell wall biosynthesis